MFTVKSLPKFSFSRGFLTRSSPNKQIIFYWIVKSIIHKYLNSKWASWIFPSNIKTIEFVLNYKLNSLSHKSSSKWIGVNHQTKWDIWLSKSFKNTKFYIRIWIIYFLVKSVNLPPTEIKTFKFGFSDFKAIVRLNKSLKHILIKLIN